MRSVWFLPEAVSDLEEAAGWYSRQELGLGEVFEAAVEAKLTQVASEPRAFPVALGRIRRALLSRFPYGLFYLEEADRIVVVACLHAAQDPRSWKRRAGGS
ncbi:MAG TPA: type II toxin-antitoxin system RelE/ParE family toxin [Planctomycetota bacterium]